MSFEGEKLRESEATAGREAFLAYVRSQLVGPCGGPDEVIADPPNRRYLMGILFPRKVEFEGYMDGEGERVEPDVAGKTDREEDLFADDPVASANDFLPASQGISFFTSATAVEVRASGARYATLEGDDAAAALAAASQPLALSSGPVDTPAGDRSGRRRKRVWQRRPLPSDPKVVSADSSAVVPVLDGAAELHVKWRDFGTGSLVTVSMVNSASTDAEKDLAWDDMVLQVGLEIVPVGEGEFLEYPSARLASQEPEELQLRLQYRHARTFAVGHGCAAAWEVDGAGRVVRLASEVMPREEVPRVSAGESDDRVLDLAYLSDESVEPAALLADLGEFVDGYAEWVAGQVIASAAVPEWGMQAGQQIVERLSETVSRMRAGVQLLGESDPRVLRAFRLANRAMATQMRRSRSDLGGSRRPRSAVIPEAVQPGAARWRPFQLGFALVALPGLARPERPDRNVADLIWFPTGGGKTEAYLLLASFEIMHRRLLDKVRGAGTTVLSRYTLSLLTTQQFQRAAATICALEEIRRRDPHLLGVDPISIGLWVGQTTTPNRYQKAAEEFAILRDDPEPDDRFLLERCPWCGTEILPRSFSDDADDYGIRATDTSFEFFCPRDSCEFHDHLPVHVVDDDLYDHPPTFVLGTVDKFAGLAWEARAGCFFGDGGKRRPPTLIIQDELHLLSGPLGTTMGVYEAAIQMLCEEGGRPAKVVASTATIRRAPDQVLGLFGRGVQLFPPTGLDSRDSYFATVDTDAPGRLYVGLMAQGHTADTATVHTGAALLQAPLAAKLNGDARDGYSTLVAYHSSLRELGRTVTIARDDIPARLASVVGSGVPREVEVEELTANVERAQQPRLLERLNRHCDEAGSIDFLATTNMLSVGVDVPRLGLMLVNGQPKSTAEYIQASSRVGRDKTPGLVFSMFRSTRPRDRSHYEAFSAYHAALYRYVEPTSVTPFSPPSRKRSLHASLVILIRHKLGLRNEADASRIESHLAEAQDLIDRLVEVVERVEPREASGARRNLEDFLKGWVEDAREANRLKKCLYYESQGKGQLNLLRDFFRRGQGRETLRSMRNVDRSCLVMVHRRGHS